MSDTDNNRENKVNPVDQLDTTPMPEVKALSFSDIFACFQQGISDFRHAPFFGLFFGGIFAFGGLLIIQSMYVWEKGWMIYPLVIGFPLIGPFAAVGLYEVSRRRSEDLPLRWNEILRVVSLQTSREIPWMAFVMLFIFWVWIYQVRLLLALFLGRMSFTSFGSFFEIITTTPQGLTFIIVGHVVGACFALFMFSVTVISIPLLLDRDVDFITAMITSIKTVVASPVVMLSWGVFVTLAVMFSFLPLFLGLLIVLPVLGHTTWHLYKRAVV